MTEILELYKCEICGNLVEVVKSSFGELVCCNEPMKKLDAKTHDENASLEHHVPVIEHTESGLVIKVGKEPHPMLPEHHIDFIEVCSDDKKYVKRKYLKVGEEPKLEMNCNCQNIKARAICNLHGLFKSE